MCLHCGDPFSIEKVLGPLLGHSSCTQSGKIDRIDRRGVEMYLSKFKLIVVCFILLMFKKKYPHNRLNKSYRVAK